MEQPRMDASALTSLPEMGGDQLLALAELDGKALQALMRDIGIPARPQMLVDLQQDGVVYQHRKLGCRRI